MNQPFFSVIVPVFKRGGELEDGLNAFANLDYPPHRFEVIIVDDGSPKSPGPIVDKFSGKMDVRLVLQHHAGPAAARNRGIKEARGEFIAFTDSDCQVDRNWLTVLASEFAKSPEAVVGGHTINRLEGNIYSSASQMIIDYLYSYYNKDPGHSQFLTSNNLAFPAEILRSLGGFNQKFSHPAAEDRDLCDRCVLNGYQLFYSPEAIVYHSHHLHLISFWIQHFNYGRGAFLFHTARKKRNKSEIKIEPLSFYFDFLKYPMNQTKGLRIIPLVLLMGISQVGNAMGFFRMKLLMGDQEIC